jgi:hypothetical protein
MGTNGSFPAENQQQEAAKQTILIDWIAEE